MNALEVAERAVGHGGPDALALVRSERSLALRFAANKPTQLTAIDDVTVELAAVRDGQVGRSATNAVDDESLAACAGRAAAAAAAAAASGAGGFPGFARPEMPASDGAGDDGAAALDPDVGGAQLVAAFEVAREHGIEAHGMWTAATEERAVATRGGGCAERSVDAFMKVVCIAPSGRSGYAAQTARDPASLDGRALTLEAAAKAVPPGEPAELPPGEYPVVLHAHAVGCLLDLLACSAFEGLAHAEGRGALSGRLGESVAAPTISLADAPSHPLTLRRSFDAEGTRKQPLPLIQDGVAHRVAHDRRSAPLAGTESTGHALSPGGAAEGAYPTNLTLAGGGAQSAADLCRRVERGIYVTRLWYANMVRPKETLVTAVTRDGTFLIEDGRITRPLRDLRVSDRVLDILSRVKDLGREQMLTSEGEFYGRRFANGVVCPPLLTSAVRFSDAAG